jgi:flavin-dependent dehydrogenase
VRDLVVVGGGPTGLASALHAARAGLSVEVRERRHGVVDKACGEGLMPGAVAALTGLGVELRGRPLEGIHYLDGDRDARAAFRRGPGLGVRRTALHSALLEAVDRAGVPVRREPVHDVQVRDDHVLVDGDPTAYVIAADGLHSPLRRHLGLQAEPGRVRRYGLRTHAATAPWSRFVEVHWSPRAEAYVTPVGDDLVGVAVLSAERGADLPTLLADFPALGERLRGVATGRVLGAGPLRQRSRARVAGRVLLVGDAAGYVDALTGEGISVGLAHARAAVEAVVADDPAGYEAAWRCIGRSQHLLTAGLLTATRVPLVRRRLVATAGRVPWAFGAAVDQLARPA